MLGWKPRLGDDQEVPLALKNVWESVKVTEAKFGMYSGAVFLNVLYGREI